MSKSILIASGKGGCGKSTLAVNCGAVLAGLGRKVLLIDTDAGLRALDMLLSVSDRVVYDLSDVLASRCEPVKAIVATAVAGLELLPAPSEAYDGVFEPEGFRKLCKGLARYYDYLLLDSPAGIGAGMLTAAAAADRAVVIATADPLAVRDAGRVAQVLRGLGMADIRLVLNRVVPSLIRRKTAYSLDGAIDGASIRLLGIVPEDRRVTVAGYEGKPVAPGRKGAGAAFSNIARRIDGEDIPLMNL